MVASSFRGGSRRFQYRTAQGSRRRILLVLTFLVLVFFIISMALLSSLIAPSVLEERFHPVLPVPVVSVDNMKKDIGLILDRTENETYLTELRGLSCPPYDASALDRLQIPLEHLPRKKPTSVATKYNRRAHNCLSNGIWHRVRAEDHREILHGIVRLAGIKNNSFVLDWGSGCGHSMQVMHEAYGVISVGIDVANATIFYARNITSKKLLHCVADGTNMTWIPTNFFDHVISFGSVLHVFNQTLFCHVLRQMLRVVKPLGTVYNGWSEENDFKREHVSLCLSDLPVTYEIIEEKFAFSNVKIFPLKAKQTSPNTYSLVITKGSKENISIIPDSIYNDVNAVPFRCGGPKNMVCTEYNKKFENSLNIHSYISEEFHNKIDWPACPPYDSSFELRQIPLEHLPRKKPTSVAQKYDRRANNCQKDGIWHRVSINDHENILRVIAGLIEVKEGNKLLDWGSGCGHHLQFMHDFYGVIGLGIDISNKTTEYARAMTSKKNQYCVADGTKLDWLPSDFFDHAYSFGSIYHVYNETLFCSVIQQMIRVVKPGGKIYNGWTEDSEFPRTKVEPCITKVYSSKCFKIEIMEEVELFKHVKRFPLKAHRTVPNTYSLLIHKLSSCPST